MTKISKFAPTSVPEIHDVVGVRMATTCCGIKNHDKDDLLLVGLAPGTQVGGVFTKSTTAAAPVRWCQRILTRQSPRGLVVNSGNANAFSGIAGLQIVEQEAMAAGMALGVDPDDIFVASTGVIGELLPVDQIVGQLPALAQNLQSNQWHQASNCITTTDTYPKTSTRQTQIGDTEVTISGYAKGAGMIMPDMATMLCFVYTDATVPSDVLQQLTREGMENSFHAITVDSDTSTNDTVLLFATAQVAHPAVQSAQDPVLSPFRDALFECFHDLAMQVVADAEGISKLVAVSVAGAANDADAKKVAMSIANSPLVKTAVAGQDANWGRVAMAVGKSGVSLNQSKVSIAFGSHQLALNGNPIILQSTQEIDEYMHNDRIEINVGIGDGSGKMTVWTSDLTHDYVSINADYRS